MPKQNKERNHTQLIQENSLAIGTFGGLDEVFLYV
jgi:hypothetical protein